jgi:hypothetical protein
MRRLLKTAIVLSVLSLGLIAGFIIALFSVWTGVLDVSHSVADYQYLQDKDGNYLKVPTHEESLSISAHTEPYRTSPVVDLFNDKEAK